jgi:predicted TIM-barrel fold metal-dependent hydrolase
MKTNHGYLSISRRHWLALASAVVARPANLFAKPSTVDPAAPVPVSDSIIDAHVHVWPKFGTLYPLASEFSEKDVVPASFTPDELFSHCRPLQVTRVVLIQMNFFGFDNTYMLDCIEKYPGIFSGVAVIDHDQSDVKGTMTDLRKRGVRGYRLYANRANVAQWQNSRGIRSMFEHGAETGQAMCMLSDPDAIPGIENLCERHPKTTVVIDHFSRIGMRGSVQEDELNALCRLAKYPTVYVKTSAFYALGLKKAPYTDLLPMIRRLRDAFGAERLMWASDCPYQVDAPHTYGASVELVRDRADFLNKDEKRQILSGTAEKVFFGQ